LYYLSASNIAECLEGLTESNIVAAIEQTNLLMSCQGTNVAWSIETNGYGVSFYGTAIESQYASENVYWLETGAGTTFAILPGSGPSPTNTDQTYLESLHFEEDHEEATHTNMFTDPEGDFWLWDWLWPGLVGWDTKDIQFETHGAADAHESTISLFLKGGTDFGGMTDHFARVYLNGEFIASNRWDGFQTIQVDMATTNLVGTNAFSVKGGDDGQTYDGRHFYIESFDVVYDRCYRAVNDTLLLRGDSNAVVTVSGFSTSAVRAIDVTNPGQPKELTAITIDLETNGDYRVSFVPESPTNEYLTVVRGTTCAGMTGRGYSGLLAATNQLDYVVVTVSGFEDSLTPLIERREEQGLRCRVADIEEIYDDFNFGVASPWAIRSFLEYALSSWETPPGYILLAGNGSYDYKNNKGYEDCLVPPAMILGWERLQGADNPLADVDKDDVPNVAIGRIPALNADEVTDMIDKILAYEETSGPWKQRVVMLADIPDQTFHEDSDTVAALLPTNYPVTNIYAQFGAISTYRTQLINNVNAGVGLVNYLGHASENQLGSEDGLLRKQDVALLTNSTAPSVMLGMTCLFGRFAVPRAADKQPLGKQLVKKSDGGLAALWSPTCEAFEGPNSALAQEFLLRMFSKGDARLGQAIRNALAAYEPIPAYRYHLQAYALQGDPAMPMAPPGFSYEDWRRLWFQGADLTNDTVSGRMADPDLNGIVNLMEFALNRNPTNGSYSAEFISDLTNDNVTVTFPRRRRREGIDYFVEMCNDLLTQEWRSSTNDIEFIATNNVDDVMDSVITELRDPLVSGTQIFVRTRVTLE